MYFDAALKKIQVTNFKTVKPLKQNDACKRDLFFLADQNKNKEKRKKKKKRSINEVVRHSLMTQPAL